MSKDLLENQSHSPPYIKAAHSPIIEPHSGRETFRESRVAVQWLNKNERVGPRGHEREKEREKERNFREKERDERGEIEWWNEE